MKTPIRNLSFAKTCCILAALGASLVASMAAAPVTFECNAVYIAAPVYSNQRQTGKMTHSTVFAPAVLVQSQNQFFNGLLSWTGEFTQDAAGNFVGSGTGEMIIRGGKWATHFEVRGSLTTGYVGKVVSHGVEGVVAGMVAIEEFEGIQELFDFGDGNPPVLTNVEHYTGFLVTPGGN